MLEKGRVYKLACAGIGGVMIMVLIGVILIGVSLISK
jgi:hypothetical protein